MTSFGADDRDRVDLPKLCWICSNPADTGEHMAKATDFRLLFRGVDRPKPVYRTENGRNRKLVQGPNSDLLKFPRSLCGYCNSTRTQPYDSAWELFANFIASISDHSRGCEIDLPTVFGATYETGAISLHLYLVKQLGCHAVLNDIDLPISQFEAALISSVPHPNVWIDFVSISSPTVSDLIVGRPKALSVNDQIAMVYWEYVLGPIGVVVTYSELLSSLPLQQRGWHPATSPRCITLR